VIQPFLAGKVPPTAFGQISQLFRAPIATGFAGPGLGKPNRAACANLGALRPFAHSQLSQVWVAAVAGVCFKTRTATVGRLAINGGPLAPTNPAARSGWARRQRW